MIEVLKTLLAAAKLPASETEIAAYAAAYGPQRAAVDALYEVSAARYADPALRFRASARIEDWSA
ncbi:hypothetical protein ORV05_25730 [Amycolatopsis cynarae]|uniref:Uncharacterized protein n=1 Tax=Amycolatopsis cynarae TaxID=2995223 RepID=A0ABY7AX96_9PSEU|nr:hypothetical protein [Amycolatopsis sp. HUAS 11-8]WAL64347.1 hypothetical protein ORV05_25730 [Amycolatopsis sp. HUAS 11-8]